jgi:hypothetical protein
LVRAIINVTATIEIVMPKTIFVVNGSWNISVPINMAVIGSKTPNTEAFVAPILRVAMASDAVETMVGSRANPAKLSQSTYSVIPNVMAVSETMI